MSLNMFLVIKNIYTIPYSSTDRYLHRDEPVEEIRIDCCLFLEPFIGPGGRQSAHLWCLFHLQTTHFQNRFPRLGWLPGNQLNNNLCSHSKFYIFLP